MFISTYSGLAWSELRPLSISQAEGEQVVKSIRQVRTRSYSGQLGLQYLGTILAGVAFR
jgi:hypothetical protein